MTLTRNSKVAFDQDYIGSKMHTEVVDQPAVDDVIAFMSQSEAQRKYVLNPRGAGRDTQTPSDTLKSFLENVET